MSGTTRYTVPASDSPGFLLWQVTMRWQRTMTATLAPLDLTHVQFVLLACAWWFDQEGERPNQARLAAQAGVDVKMASEVIRRLEAKRLIARTDDPFDSRGKVITITESGGSVATAAIRAVEAADAAFFSSIDERVLAQTLRGLAQADSGR